MNLLKIGAILFALVVSPALAGSDEGVYELGVDGLSCPFCAYGIEKELSRVAGVAAIDTDIEKGLITVRMTNGATLDEPTARKAAEDAGFSLRSFAEAAAE